MPRFYLIDDEIWALQSLEALLREFPFVEDVHTFLDGRKALEAIVADPPDVIFTDLRMDRLSGRSLISMIRTRGIQVPIVIISAYSDFDVAREALSFGVFDYLLKPVSRAALQTMMLRLEAHLSTHGAQSPTIQARHDVEAAYPECRIVAYPSKDHDTKAALTAAAQADCALRFDSEIRQGFSFACLSNPVNQLPQGIAALGKAVGLSRPQTGFDELRMMRQEALMAAQCGFHFADNRRVSEIQSYLVLNYEQPLKLDELAVRFYMNKTYLCDMFRKECGVTMVSFLRDIRMATAARLLRDTRDTVQNIAARVGYTDSAYFTRIFRSLYGMSPEAYRRNRQA